MRSHISGADQLARCGSGVLGQPLTKGAPRRVFFSRKGEIHVAKRRLYR
jgi:hypothetical protein